MALCDLLLCDHGKKSRLKFIGNYVKVMVITQYLELRFGGRPISSKKVAQMCMMNLTVDVPSLDALLLPPILKYDTIFKINYILIISCLKNAGLAHGPSKHTYLFD